jgi:hypothetical protein
VREVASRNTFTAIAAPRPALARWQHVPRGVERSAGFVPGSDTSGNSETLEME